MHWCPGNAHTKRRPASAGTLGKRGRGGDDDDDDDDDDDEVVLKGAVLPRFR